LCIALPHHVVVGCNIVYTLPALTPINSLLKYRMETSMARPDASGARTGSTVPITETSSKSQTARGAAPWRRARRRPRPRRTRLGHRRPAAPAMRVLRHTRGHAPGLHVGELHELARRCGIGRRLRTLSLPTCWEGEEGGKGVRKFGLASKTI
jgi:hypothetical protein